LPSERTVSADGHLADNHRLKFVLWSLPANDCNHGIQFGRIDCAISLTERLGDAFKFDTHHRRTRRAKSRHELGAPAVQVGMLRLDLRAHIETGLHLGDHLLRRWRVSRLRRAPELPLAATLIA